VGGRGAGPRATAEGTRAATPRTAAARHEEIRVCLVRRTTRARQTAGHPDEHAQPAFWIHLRPSPESAAFPRTHTRVTPTRVPTDAPVQSADFFPLSQNRHDLVRQLCSALYW